MSDLNILNEDDDNDLRLKNNKFNLKNIFIIVLLVIVNFSGSFIYDNPSALEDVMIESLPHVTYSTISSFYSWYSWPNVVLCIVNGYLIDKILGYRVATILFTSLVTIGQLMFVYGTFIRTIWLMQVARLIYGIGCEPLQMCTFKYCTKWFKEQNRLSMAITVVYCVPNLGSVLNLLIMLPIYRWINNLLSIESHKSLALTLLVSACVAILSTISAIILLWLDVKKKHVDKENTQEGLNLKEIIRFPNVFWMICLICVLYYATLFPYIGSVKSFYMFKYGLNSFSANFCNSLIYIVASLLSPFIGKTVDKIGFNLSFLIVSVSCFIIIHFFIAFTYLNPYICSAAIGFVNTFTAASLWPLVSVVISTDRIATAYGTMQSIQNLGLAIANLLVGNIIDSYGYFILELIYIIILLSTLISTMILCFLNDLKNLNLNVNKLKTQ